MEPTPIEQKLREELKQTAEKLRGSEQEKRRLQERNEELQLAFEEADKDAREAEALNGHLQRRVDEMEVQIAALRQYESEFDQKVTKMLDERDEALTLAAKDKEAILLKVKELQEELAMQKSPGSNLADASELAMMLKERQLEIEDLLDRNEELEEDLARVREELEKRPGRVPPGTDVSSMSAGLPGAGLEQYEERLRNLKADALEKDARLLDAEKKLDHLAKGMGAEAILAENRQLAREASEMKRQVAEAKRDLSVYLSEAASIVYENDLLRGLANVKPGQLKLQDFKLKDKVTSAKATAVAKHLEKEVADLEAERTKLKLRVRQLSELAAEKVSLLHDLQPEQMLQLEEIAARMRQGKLELPLDDQSRVLKEERDELKKRLSMKDHEIAQHIDRKVDEVLQKQGKTKDLEVKLEAIQKDNEILKSSLEAYRSAYANLAQGGPVTDPESFLRQGPRPPPLPGAPPGVPPPPPAPGQRFGLAVPAVLPRIPGMQPSVWSSLLQAGLQLPAELADGAPETVCSLYCQVVEALEELSRERTVRAHLGEEVAAFQEKYDRLLAEQEVLYKDYFAQKDQWLRERKELEERLQAQGNLYMDSMKKCEVQEEQLKIWQRLEVGGPEGVLREELMQAMTRCAALEQNESVLSRKYEAEKQNHGIVKDAFDTMQKDFLEREGFLKERFSKAILWKRRSANALRIARRKIQSMVAGSDFERAQQQLQVCRQREFDLSRRVTELTMKVSQQEDKLRDMMDLQDRCRSLDHLVRETEQEFTVLRRRLQQKEPRFAAECGLFARLTAELQRTLGFAGSFEAASRALSYSEARVLGEDKTEQVQVLNVELSLDEKLRKLDSNNDGFIGLPDLRRFLEGLSIKIKDEEMQLLADALHPSTPLLPSVPPPAPPGQPSPPPPSPPAPEEKASASVSILGIVGRFRLFGLRALDPEELFWCAWQAHLLRRPDQPSAPEILRNFQPLRNAEGQIAATDILQLLTQFEVTANQLPLRSLRRVLQWIGVEARQLDEFLPLKQLPSPGDPQEPEYRLKLQQIRLAYADFAERVERGLARAYVQLRPPEAEALAPEPRAPEPNDAEARCHMARARESAANRRCVVLEQEVRTKDRIVRELQRQVGELEGVLERLEAELYDERGSKVRLMAELDEALPKAEVEPKLRQIEELRFQVDQSSIALKQAKDLARTCASQSESYEKLLKRRQQEVRHLQESVKFLQATDEMSNTVGKLQYRLLLSQWEKGNLQRQLQAATQDLREARREVLENEEQVEQERQQHDETEEQLQQQLLLLKAKASKLQEESSAAMPIDKARQLTSRLEEISSRKMELEERLSKVRLELLRNQAETDECRLKAQQAQELMKELKALDPDDEAPRQRLLEMAKKLAESKLKELQHKRNLEIAQEQHQQLANARKADEKEIQSLQREVAQAESKLANQEVQWRQKVLEAQGVAPQAAPRSSLRRASQGTVETLEQMQTKLLERDARISVLEADLQKAKGEQEKAVSEERLKVRKLELELNLLSDGDTLKLRHQLRSEHDAEVQLISQAAEASVQTLQELLDQTEERLRQQQLEMSRLYEKQSEMQNKHQEETLQLQQEIATVRQELVQARHQHAHDSDAAARLTPLAPDESARLAESFGSEGFGEVQDRLNDRLQQNQNQVLNLYHRLEQQQEEFNSLLEQQHTEAKQREDQLREYQQKMQQDFQAREQRLLDQFESQRGQRELELQRIQQELSGLRTGAKGTSQELQEQVAEAQRHATMALKHNEQLEEHRVSAEQWHQHAQQLEKQKDELEKELRQEREKHKDSQLRKHSAQLRRQLAQKEEQLSSMKKAVEELKDRVVQLSIRNEREELESGNARKAETEVRKRIGGHEKKMQHLKDQVARLSKQLQEAKVLQNREAFQTAEMDGREAELQRLLEESGKELQMKAAEASRLEEELLRQQRRCAAAEAALKAERGVLEGEARLVKRQGEEALESNARRVASLLDKIEVLQAERMELSAKLQGAEAALLNRSPRGLPPVRGAAVAPEVELAETKERLKREQDLRQSLQQEVRDLAVQLELGRRPDRPDLPSKRGASPASPAPSSLSPGPRGGSRSPAPRSLKQASELAARCGQLQAELAQMKAKKQHLEEENDDLKLRLASEGGAPRSSAEGMAQAAVGQAGLAALVANPARLATEAQAQDALRLHQLTQECALLQRRVEELSRENLQVRLGGEGAAQAAAAQAAQRAAALAMEQQIQLQRMQEKNATLELQMDELRRAGISAGSQQLQVQHLQEKNASLEFQLEELRRATSVPGEPNSTMQRLQDKNAALEAQVEALRRATGIPVEHQIQMQHLQEKNAALEVQVEELRRERLPAPLPGPTEAAQALQARVDDLVRENFQLQRQGASGMAAEQKLVAELQARNEELLRENLQLRSVAASPTPPSPPQPPAPTAALAAAQQMMELQVKNQELLRENLELRQVAPQGEVDQVLAAKRHADELQARVDELLRENATLHQDLRTRPAVSVLGSPAKAEDLGELRRLQNEVSSQRRVLERMVSHLTSENGSSAFEHLVEECQGLLQRLAVLQDENVMLRCRAGELASTHRTRGEGAVQEANAVLRAEVDSLIAELSATTTWKEEAAKRLVNQAAEIERLRHERLASLEALDLRPEAPEANLRPQLERSEQERRSLEKYLAAQTSRVAELSTDLEDLRQRLREVTFATSDLLSPPEAVVRERIRLEYEEQLRQQKLKVQKSEEEAQELRKTNEKLQVQVEQHVRNQVDLTRQVGESRHLDSPAAVPGMEEVANRLAQRNEDLAEENAQLLKDVEDLKRAHAEEMKRQTDLGQGELQAKRAQAVEMVKSRAPRLEGAPWNPLRELRELVIQKEERGEEGALRGMVKGFDHERSSLMSWPMFKALLRDQVGLDALNEEKMEFAEYIFQALDDDGDGIVPYPDFEKAILGDARGPLTELLLQLAQALRTANLRLHQLVRMHDEMNDGELGREELMQIFLRINLRLRDLDLDRLMAEFDCGRRSISVAELQFRVEAARVEEIMGELKVQLARYGAGALQQTFADADEDYSGRLSFSQLEGVLLHELKLPMSREVLQELFDLFNTDQTGQISYRELLNRCGLAQSQASLQWIHEILPPADRPRWLEQTLCAVKRALLMALREEERFGDGAKRLLGDFDERKAGALSLAQLRRALKSLGLSAGQREMERLCEQLRGVQLPRDAPRNARGGPRGGQQGPQRARMELHIDNLLSRLQSVHVAEEDEIAKRGQALPVAQVLFAQLQRRNLSLMKVLDPDMHGKISFGALKSACQRHQLGLQEEDFARLATLLAPDRRELFPREKLQRLLKAAEEASKPTEKAANLTSAVQGTGQALESLPKHRPGLVQDRRLDGAVEARHRQKVDQLQAALFQSEEERRRVERELQSLRQEEQTRNEENPRPLHVLLSAGEKAPPLVKELKLEVKGTRELRDKIYTLEAELESCKRRLEVDARQQIEKEQSRVRQLNLELEDKERHVSELIFDLKRARSAAGEGDWAQREEEYMRLNLQLRRLEEELTASRRNEQQSAERLLDAEHQILELRFDREQGQHRSSRLETRILELELAEQEPRRAEGPPAAMASKLQSRKERNLENVIEGLGRVIHQQKGDLQRLRVELERRPERKGEMEKLRRRVQELEARQQEVPRAGLVDELRQALNTKEERLNALEQQLQGTPAQVPPRAPDASSTAEVQRLQQELAELRRARGEDAAALDEAQRALHEAERTEQRYLEVVRENRRLQQELSALDDEGFWEEIQQLQKRNEQAASLARESKEALEHLAPAAGALDFTGLIARLDVFSRPAA